MTTATVIAFEPVHACWQALIDESIERFHHFPSVPHLAPITDGSSLVVWDNLSRCIGTDNRATSYLHAALVAQANRYRRDGLSVSAADCALIAHWLSEGALTVIGAHHIS